MFILAAVNIMKMKTQIVYIILETNWYTSFYLTLAIKN